VTSRASHYNPNIAQVPASSKPYGHECRSLFTVLPGFKQLGADMKSLEGLCLAHYLAKHDGGAYGRGLLAGDADTHWDNVLNMGFLPAGTERNKDDKLHTLLRETGAKRGFYAVLYGTGDKKAGRIILDACRAARKLDPVRGGEVYARHLSSDAPSDKELRNVGKLAKFNIIRGIPGLSRLKQTISDGLAERSTLPGLDKRRLPVRSEHSALNLLLQSAGAILCKRWIVDAYKALVAAGYKWGWNGDFVFLGWIHDEIQVAVRAGLEEEVGNIIVQCARNAGKPYGFRLPLDSDYKVGASWADTH